MVSPGLTGSVRSVGDGLESLHLRLRHLTPLALLTPPVRGHAPRLVHRQRRPPQQVVRPPSLTHIAQVCGGWTIKDPVNAKLRPGPA